MSRLATRTGDKRDLAEIWNLLLLLLPGSLSAYYGDEIGMANSKKLVR